ncbi:DsbA family protein [Pseudomonas quasicaspiana]|uniref:DsbA family protein n=1 Tax=Pseudomonas quasicaspiana TaxID=2829821 RepID=UPI001E5176D5|nr:thioredoxin domain-containing protein [Pseudomonas quasicaspiana]MCD5972332.1 DsbA family protein [Pseudomonas quasicaspiana]
MKRPMGLHKIAACSIVAIALAVWSYAWLHDTGYKPAEPADDQVGMTPLSNTRSGGWVYGSRGARFTVIEYGDLECPYCKDYFPHLKAWLDQHPDVNLQWHHLPLSMHEPVAGYEARWAECAGIEGGNKAFWMALEIIYQRTRSNGLGVAVNPQVPGLEDRQNAIDECAANDISVQRTVRSQAHQASLEGVTATPTLVVKDNLTARSIKLEGAPDGDLLLSAIDWLARTDARDGHK